MNKLLAFIIATFLLSACSDSADYEQPIRTILSDFKSQKWQRLYNCQTNEFKSRVPLEVYLREMQKESESLAIKSYRIVDIEKRYFRYLDVDVEYIVASSKNDERAVSSMEQVAFEIDSDGKLLCLNLGLSIFYPLNGYK